MISKFIPLIAVALISQNAFAFPTHSKAADAAFVKALAERSLAENFDGIVALPNCSGAAVRFTNDSKAKAVVLTNGHCYKLLAPGTMAANVPYTATVNIYDQAGKKHAYKLTRLIYSTMTATDVSLFELSVNYETLEAAGIHAYELDSAPARTGDQIHMVSGYFHTYATCGITGIIPMLKEDQWTFMGAYQYQECVSIHGTSGSPLISATTNRIVGINNTHNDDGERCTLNNPCEVAANGTITVVPGMSYGQRTDQILTCVNAQGQFDLKTAGCQLQR